MNRTLTLGRSVARATLRSSRVFAASSSSSSSLYSHRTAPHYAVSARSFSTEEFRFNPDVSSKFAQERTPCGVLYKSISEVRVRVVIRLECLFIQCLCAKRPDVGRCVQMGLFSHALYLESV